MSSLIPKISIGRDTKRNHFDLSCMTHTTSEIGYVQPTFGRTIVPKSKVRVATRTGSRLSPLYVPTMGKIAIRHYHCFVPYSTIWTPFDSFLTKQNYTLPTGETYVPSSMPKFKVGSIIRALTTFNTEFTSGYDPKNDLTGCFIVPSVSSGSEMASDAVIQDYRSDTYDLDSVIRGGYFPLYIISKEGHIWKTFKDGNKWDLVPLFASGKDFDEALQAKKNLSFPSHLNFDFQECTYDDNELSFYIGINFNGGLKRLRTIFLGLGYSFNPFDQTFVTPLKLLAFYKAYYSLFGVNRERNFYNTYCYKTIKYLSENIVSSMHELISHPVLVALWINFIRLELSNCTYTCPVDYFSAADITTSRGANNETLSSPLTIGSVSYNVGATDIASDTGLGSNVSVFGTGDFGSDPASNPLAQRIALRLLRFVNKNSVIGRKISDILRTRYGVSDEHNTTHESIIRVGASSTDIEVAAIYSNTETEDIPLGGYAGAAVSSRHNANSKSFTFETNEFGCLITLTSVVPKMGYFQGMFRENSDGVTDFTEWWCPEFDSLGWQAVRYNELVADRMIKADVVDPNVGTDLGIWGYLPRMTHLKCSFNRCLGDISIPHMQDSMLPYTLDRYFENRRITSYGTVVNASLPVNEAQSFRSGTQGQTNRIFTDLTPTEDHVIMQIFFDIKMVSPMKSISSSFDTWDEESEQSVEVSHE